MKQDDLFKKGLKIRREVLGQEYVDKTLKNADRYSRPMIELATRVVWGTIWSRPGLSRRSRSFINLGMLIAMGQQLELRLHIRAALRNGLSRKEISETILHCAAYCIPKAADARRAMCEVFAELDREKSTPTRRGYKR